MKRIVWIFVSGIFFTAATDITIAELEKTNNSVKIALGAALGLNNTNNTDNIQFLDKVQKVIGKIKTVMEHNSNKRRNYGGVNDKKFTDFVQEIIKKLSQFDDSDLEMFCSIFNDEITKYHYRGCKFYEITENNNFRSLLSNLLHEIKIQPINKTKRILKTVANKLEKKSYNENERELVDTINSLYRQDSLEKLENFLVNIDAFRLKTRKNLDLVNIVRNGLRTSIFDHYTNLNRNARKALKVQINEYFKEFSPQTTTKFIDSIKYSKVQKLALTTKKPPIVKETKKYIIKDLKHNNTDYARSDLNEYTKSSLYLNTPLIISKLNSNKSLISNEHIKKAYGDTRKDAHGKRQISRNSSNNTTHSQNKTIGPVKTTQSFRTKNNPYMKYETDAYEYILTENKRKKLTFRTLYPKFVYEVTESKPQLAGRRSFRETTVRTSEYSWEEDEINTSIQRPRRERPIHLVKELGGSIKIGIKSSPKRKMDSKYRKLSRTTAQSPPYSWEEDDINNSIEKVKRMKAIRIVKDLGATVKIGMKGEEPMRRSNAKCQNSKKKVENYHESLWNSIRRSIAEVTSLERKIRLREPFKSNLTRRSNRRSNIQSAPASTGKNFKMYNWRNAIHNSDLNNSLPATTNTTKVQVSPVGKGISVQMNNDTILESIKNETNSERNEYQNKISSNNKNYDKVEYTNLVHDNTPKDNNKEYLEIPKNTQVGEEIKYIKDSHEYKSTPEIYKHPVNVTNVEENKEKQLVTLLNLQKDKKVTPKLYAKENIKNYAPQKFDPNNTEGEYNYKIRSPIEGGTKANNFDLSRQKMDNNNNLEHAVDSKYELKTDEVEVETKKDEQVANYDENDSEQDLEPWVPQRDNDLKKEIEDYENDYAEQERKKQERKDNIVFRSFDSKPQSTNKNIVTIKDNNMEAITTNQIITVTIKPRISLTTAAITNPKKNFANIAPFAYVDNKKIFADIDKLTTKQTNVKKSQAQHVIKNFPIKDSMEKLKREVLNSGEINFGDDMHYGSDRENPKKDDITGDVFPEADQALGKIAVRI
ncbi:unnamed protein product [Arctia plantaginis]|uniref:Uncharacterized protein n=1 Tax=Arctia plantaginis TaxID=874455 RepID=A0A8S1B602_ARCPL|nr:unnamed protein product [Arctia plantaginis]